MSDIQPADAADAAGTQVPAPAPAPAPVPVPASVPADLPLAFVAFHDLHAQRYTDYAFAHLGDADVALELVEDVLLALAERWDRVMCRPRPAAYAWALLRRVVEAECTWRREHLALVEEAAFAYALIRRAEKALEEIDRSMVGDLEVGISVARAIRDLPGRQHDVVVLRFLGCYGPHQIAEVMGIEEGTVRSLISQARTRLRVRLAQRRTLEPGRTNDEE
ncbi:RNA polymerase sigma factor [Kitasatospora sp. NPDC056783]|uniref:RNA polymerase sigma factor n=1 Tax=Kitasatospora sp. NPDC056783 TaxID=3345943 RepID=UPI0036A41BE8